MPIAFLDGLRRRSEAVGLPERDTPPQNRAWTDTLKVRGGAGNR